LREIPEIGNLVALQGENTDGVLPRWGCMAFGGIGNVFSKCQIPF